MPAALDPPLTWVPKEKPAWLLWLVQGKVKRRLVPSVLLSWFLLWPVALAAVSLLLEPK